ncbi:MAG: NAD+ synthase [Elusimicrobia bacterium]|nr:NAD+ synthase [Elusimicrobiota bacterium]
MKIALAQIDTKVGDIRGNIEKIADYAARAGRLGAELVVFPEQALGGYPALDLWEDPGFIEANERGLKTLARLQGPALLVGLVKRNPRRTGKPILNAAALLYRNRVAALRSKSLLPTYDVFDETRYFEPARDNPPVRFKGLRIGISVCEDAWARETFGERQLYTRDPIGEQVRSGVDLLINLSASPFSRGKNAARARLLRRQARRARKPLLYCNLVGGNDEIIFDGASLAFDGRGRVVARARAFAEDLLIFDSEAKPKPVPSSVDDPTQEVAEALVLGLRDYVRKCGFERVFIGLSGGIDSAVVATLAARALGPESVTGVLMPSPYTSQDSVDDASALAANLGIRALTLPINGIFDSYLRTLAEAFAGRSQDVTEQNLQARIRGSLLMALSNKEGGMVLATGNKSELSAGYCTLYGDMCGGLAPLADAPKGTVYELARWLNRERPLIPERSISRAPTAELKPDQKDQDDLPPYEVLDRILTSYIEERLDPGRIAARGHNPKLVAEMIRRIDFAEYKRRQAPPSLKISPKAFGVGRRMPLARGAYHAADV